MALRYPKTPRKTIALSIAMILEALCPPDCVYTRKTKTETTTERTGIKLKH